jgi:putative heme-binding domain-containing protein
LKRPEQWNRLHAKLILKHRGIDAVRQPLTTWLANLDRDATRYEHHRLEALWLHQTLDSVNEELLDDLLHAGDHRVRAAAMRVASDWRPRLRTGAISIFRDGVSDDHPRVRLEAVRALARIPTVEAARTALLALDRPVDRFLDFALWKTIRDLKVYWLPGVQDGSVDFGGNIDHLTYALQSVDSPEIARPLMKLVRNKKVPTSRSAQVLSLVASLGGPGELSQLLDMVLDPGSGLPADQRSILLDAMANTTRQRNVSPAGDLKRLTELLQSPDVQLRAAATRAAGVWKQESLRVLFHQWAVDRRETNQVRLSAVEAIASLGGPDSIKSLVAISHNAGAAEIQQRAISVLANLAPRQAAQLTVKTLSNMAAGDDPARLVAELLSRKSGPRELATALADTKLNLDVAKLVLRAVRSSGQPDPLLIAAIQKSGGLSTAGWKLTPELVSELVTEVTTKGDPHRGETVFRRNELQCLKCHAIGGAGGLVGPDLISVGASAQVDYLIESLIEPAKKVKENFHSVVVITDGGRVVTGIAVRTTDTELVLRDAEDRLITIRADSIEEKHDSRSLMPDGAADSLTRGELVDLVRFMSELGKVGEFAVSKARVARRWQTLVYTPEASHRLNRTSFDTAATNDPALTWQPAYSTVDGQLPIEGLPQLKPHRETPSTSFVRCQIDVTTPGHVVIRFNSVAGIEFWLDSKPTPVKPEMKLNLASGRHTLTLAIDRSRRTKPLQLTLDDAPESPAQAQLVSGK